MRWHARAENIAARHRDVTFVDVIGELGGTNRYLSPEQIETLGNTVDAAIARARTAAAARAG
jgi:hypothetical protein